MKRTLVGLGMAVLLSGPALARRQDRMADDAVGSDVNGGTMTVNRWAFGVAGKDKVRAAADQCAGRPIAAAHQYHDGKDIAAAFFTLGVYTPLHVTYRCAAPIR